MMIGRSIEGARFYGAQSDDLHAGALTYRLNV